MNLKICKGSPNSAGQSPSSVSSGFHSAFNVSNNALQEESQTTQLLRSKIDVLNATIVHEKCRFAQEFGDMQKHYRLRILDLEKGARAIEKIKVDPVKMEKAAIESQQFHTTIFELQKQIVELNSRPNLESKVEEMERRAEVAEQKAAKSEELELECRRLESLVSKLQKLIPELESKLTRLERRAEIAEERAAKTDGLEMEGRRLYSLVSKLQKKLTDQQKQEVPKDKSSHLEEKLAACQNRSEDMRLSYKASSKQAKNTIYALRQQLQKKEKEHSAKMADAQKEVVEQKEIYRKRLVATKEEAKKEVDKWKERNMELKAEIAEDKKRRLDVVDTKELLKQNIDFSTMCRKSLENLVDFYKQRLILSEKEKLALRAEKADSQNYLKILKSSLRVQVDQQFKERCEFEARLAAENVTTKVLVKDSDICSNPDEKQQPSVSGPKKEFKRKSFFSDDDHPPVAKQARSDLEAAQAAKTSPISHPEVCKIKEEVDCEIIKVKIKPQKVAPARTVKEETACDQSPGQQKTRIT